MPSFKIYVLPSAYWNNKANELAQSERQTLRQLICESLSIRRRIDKGVNAVAERGRYSVCLTEIESRLSRVAFDENRVSERDENRFAKIRTLLAQNEIACLTTFSDSGYFELLALTELKRLRDDSSNFEGTRGVPGVDDSPGLGACAFPPNVLDASLQELRALEKDEKIVVNSVVQNALKKRIELFEFLREQNAGVLETIDCFDNPWTGAKEDATQNLAFSQSSQGANDEFSQRKRIRAEAEREIPAVETRLSGRGKGAMLEKFTLEIAAALESDCVVNMQSYPHDVETKALGRFLYAKEDEQPGKIRVGYADGSEARPFPLRFLAPPTEYEISRFDDAVVLKTALMSMRHLELDAQVDWAWFRNNEVSQTRAWAETDEFCFQFSFRQLQELHDAYQGKRVFIKAYHTGLEPAVVGFYRAVATEIRRRRGWLQVLPVYYRGDKFEEDQTVWL